MKRTYYMGRKWSVALLMVALYAITFLFVLPSQMKDKVFSSYYMYDRADPELADRAMKKNTARLTSAKRYLNRILAESQGLHVATATTTTPSSLQTSQSYDDIAIGVISMQRSVEKERFVQLGYLTQVVAGFHRLAKEDSLFRRKHIFVCNVDAAGTQYKEASDMASLADTVVRFPESPTSIQAWERFEKEKVDYQFCLNHTLRYKTSLVILVEDDALPKDDFFHVLHQKLKSQGLISVDPEVRERALSTLGMLKLYYPEKWAGYGNESRHFMELALIAFLGACALYVTFCLVMLAVNKGIYRRATTSIMAVVVSLGALYALMVAWTMGRPYVIGYLGDTWGYHWLRPAKDCCTQSVLYSSSTAHKLVTHLGQIECDVDFSVDQAIDAYVKQYDMVALLLEPNLVTHIGMFSTLRPRSKIVGEFI